MLKQVFIYDIKAANKLVQEIYLVNVFVNLKDQPKSKFIFCIIKLLSYNYCTHISLLYY